MKLFLILLSLGAVGGTAAVVFRGSSSEKDVSSVARNTLFKVRRGDLNITITENGTLVAKDSQSISPGMNGSHKIEFLVEEGKLVEEGEEVCRLDTTDLEKEVEQLELELVQAEANLNTARTELEIQETENVANLEKAEIELEKAKKELERYREGDSKKERRNLDIAIKDTETTFTLKKKKYNDSQMLVEKGYLKQTEMELDQIEFEKAKVQLDGAKLDLELFNKFTYPMTLSDKETAVRDAERGLSTAEKRAASTLRQKEVAVEQNEKRHKKYEEQLTEKKENIDKCSLKAPCPGIVIYGDPKRWWYRREVRVGGEVWGDFTIMTIPDLRVMQVKVNIHEADINKLEEGQKASVSMDTYPGLVLKGEVTKIAGIADDEEDEVKRFPVEITLDEVKEVELKPGISAKAEIFIEEKKDVVHVPVQCVFLEEGKHLCYILGELGQPAMREVKPGLNNDSFIEILEGLEPGEEVLLYNPNLPTGPITKDPDEASEEDPADEESSSSEAEEVSANSIP